MNFQQLLQIILGRKVVIIWSFAIVVGFTVVLLAITPKTYTTAATLNFDFGGSNPYSAVRGVGFGGEASYIATQMSVIKSANVARRVYANLAEREREIVAAAIQAKRTIVDDAIDYLRKLLPADDQDEYEDVSAQLTQTGAAEPGDPNRWIVGAMGPDLEPFPVVGSRIANIRYTSTNPTVAKLLADRYAEAYIATNLEMIIDPAERTKTWFDDRLKSLRKDVETAQARLNEYQRQAGIVATDDRVDLENKRLLDLTGELSQVQQAAREVRNRATQARTRLEKGESLETFAEILNNPVIRSMRAELRQQDSKLADLSSKIGINHPQYQQVLTEIKTIRAKLQDEMRSIVEGFESEANSALQRVSAVEAALEAQKQVVLKLKDQRGAIDVLKGELDSAQLAYNTALNQMSQSSLQSLVTQANVSVLDRAFLPTSPSGPKIVQNLIFAILVGLMLGPGLAFVWEMLDRRIRTKEDLQTELRVPVIGVVLRA